ncbi:MAG: tetratricopeptide repeat protein, partial [Candidatus Peribacteraceae bacterium]|nr:tetratricopeptide repeat protein [Candidatus Peribacteraceae bacterium]
PMQEMLRKHYPYVIIVVATLLVYLPFIGNGFINIDDAGLIWNNSAVTQFDIPRIFTTFDPELYIPLTLLTYQIEYLIAGAAPTLVHATNLLLHILSALLVFSIIKKLTRNATIGLLTALLFAVHPMQGTAVLWASARKDLLSSALMLLSLHLYLRENKWSVLTFACALLSKISVAVLPVLLLLVDVWEGKPMNRDRIIEKWPYFGLSLVFGIIAIVGKTSNLGSLSVVDYLLLSAKNIVFSAQKLFVPTDLSIMYTQGGEVSILAPDFFVPVILILVIAVALFLLRKKQPVLLWCVAWFAVCMAPNLLTYVQNNNIIFTSNRYVYLACIGVFMYAATLIGLLKKGQTTLVSLVLVGVLGVFAVLHARTWSSSETLLRSALAAGYDHRMIHHNLGAALRSQDKTDEALQEFLIAGKAGNPHSYKLAGDMYGEQGNTQEKMRLYQLGMDTARKHGAYGST